MMLPQLHAIISDFLQKKNNASIQQRLTAWYGSNAQIIKNIPVVTPLSNCFSNYVRNKIYSCEEYDVFIHVMKEYGSTLVHGHGSNDVFLIPINANIKYKDYKVIPIGNDYVELHNVASGALKREVLHHKPENVNLVHRIYNDMHRQVKFVEIYIKPYVVSPIFLPVENNGSLAIGLDKFNYTISQNLFHQILEDSTGYKEFYFKDELLNHVQHDFSSIKFILLQNDKVIPSCEELCNYISRNSEYEKYTLYYMKHDYLLLRHEKM